MTVPVSRVGESNSINNGDKSVDLLPLLQASLLPAPVNLVPDRHRGSFLLP